MLLKIQRVKCITRLLCHTKHVLKISLQQFIHQHENIVSTKLVEVDEVSVRELYGIIPQPQPMIILFFSDN